MKPLTLTKEQKSKLLEMCKHFFPEYKFGFESDYAEITNIINFHKPKTQQWHEWELIHWFEFCMTHLIEKILVMPDEDSEYPFEEWSVDGFSCGSEDLIYQMNHSRKHPIDYLYSEFKKLNYEATKTRRKPNR